MGAFSSCVLYRVNMTASIPDGFSMGELELLQKVAAENDAEREAETAKDKSEALYDGKNREEVVDIAMDLVQEAIEKCNDPIVHKMMMVMIIDNFLEWHTKAGLTQMEDGEELATVSWLRDAGKFQAIANILESVTVGPHDWLSDK